MCWKVEEKNIRVWQKLEAMAKEKYEEEKERERSLLSQAANMQTVFAIVTAALFMLLPVIVDNRGNLSLDLIFIFTAIITILLVASLVCATLVQQRVKIEVLPPINETKDAVDEQEIDSEGELIAYIVDIYESTQKSREKENNHRVELICISMTLFYLSICVCIVFFTISVICLIAKG